MFPVKVCVCRGDTKLVGWGTHLSFNYFGIAVQTNQVLYSHIEFYLSNWMSSQKNNNKEISVMYKNESLTYVLSKKLHSTKIPFIRFMGP